MTFTGADSENPFDVVFRPAKPTLDAVALMREPLEWLNQRRNHRSFDLQEVLRVLPPEDDIVGAKKLFWQAEQESAPEGWTGIALALMADAMPAAHRVSDSYICAIVDAIYHDAEGQSGHGRGYSFAVITRSVREALRMTSLPIPGVFLDICFRNRRQFARWHADAAVLLSIRYDAIYGPVPF
jgi:hypothetical protein